MHQLSLIFDVVGSPSATEVSHIRNTQVPRALYITPPTKTRHATASPAIMSNTRPSLPQRTGPQVSRQPGSTCNNTVGVVAAVAVATAV